MNGFTYIKNINYRRMILVVVLPLILLILVVGYVCDVIISAYNIGCDYYKLIKQELTHYKEAWRKQ